MLVERQDDRWYTIYNVLEDELRVITDALKAYENSKISLVESGWAEEIRLKIESDLREIEDNKEMSTVK